MITHFPHVSPSLSRAAMPKHLRPKNPSSSYRYPDAAHWPPILEQQGESSADAERRAELERAARQASERIDRALALERSRRKKEKATVKILLLGQAESGKSTTLKNFQIIFAPRAFQNDAESWRMIIHLNLIRSVISLLDILTAVPQLDADVKPRHHPSLKAVVSLSLTDRERALVRSGDGHFCYKPPSSAENERGLLQTRQLVYSHELRRLMLSLLPLKSVESTLSERLGTISRSSLASLPSMPISSPPPSSLPLSIRRGASLNVVPSSGMSMSNTFLESGSSSHEVLNRANKSQPPSSPPSESAPNWKIKKFGLSRRHSTSSTESSRTSASRDVISAADSSDSHDRSLNGLQSNIKAEGEAHYLQSLVQFTVRVRGSSGWKRLARITSLSNSDADARSVLSASENRKSFLSKNSSVAEIMFKPEESHSQHEERELFASRQVIEACGEDIERLWKSEDVQRILKSSDIRMDTQAMFFLSEAKRITAQDYVPTADDVLRARLSTDGVEEHRLVLETGPETGQKWIIYDVGGSRSQRAAWAPFFDGVNLIIFLAPISAFNEWLVEDPSVNRLDDTYQLWRTVCSNRLLASVEFILFLNKIDVLREKLRSGLRFSDYVLNYDDHHGKKNDAESIARYMLSAFNSEHRQLSPKPRKLRAYLTSVIDSRATSKVLQHIREQVIVGYLAQSSLI